MDLLTGFAIFTATQPCMSVSSDIGAAKKLVFLSRFVMKKMLAEWERWAGQIGTAILNADLISKVN